MRRWHALALTSWIQASVDKFEERLNIRRSDMLERRMQGLELHLQHCGLLRFCFVGAACDERLKLTTACGHNCSVGTRLGTGRVHEHAIKEMGTIIALSQLIEGV